MNVFHKNLRLVCNQNITSENFFTKLAALEKLVDQIPNFSLCSMDIIFFKENSRLVMGIPVIGYLSNFEETGMVIRDWPSRNYIRETMRENLNFELEQLNGLDRIVIERIYQGNELNLLYWRDKCIDASLSALV